LPDRSDSHFVRPAGQTIQLHRRRNGAQLCGSTAKEA
jgi:hypothetical protein